MRESEELIRQLEKYLNEWRKARDDAAISNAELEQLLKELGDDGEP